MPEIYDILTTGRDNPIGERELLGILEYDYDRFYQELEKEREEGYPICEDMFRDKYRVPHRVYFKPAHDLELKTYLKGVGRGNAVMANCLPPCMQEKAQTLEQLATCGITKIRFDCQEDEDESEDELQEVFRISEDDLPLYSGICRCDGCSTRDRSIAQTEDFRKLIAKSLIDLLGFSTELSDFIYYKLGVCDFDDL